jgi:hypothetical protein
MACVSPIFGPYQAAGDGRDRKIGDRFRKRITPDQHALDDVRLDAGVQDLPAEADDLDRRLFVEGQGQIEADHALRNELGGLGERVVRVKRRVRELIEAAAKLDKCFPYEPCARGLSR